MIPTSATIYVAGHAGLVGSALVRRLRAAGYERLALATRSDADLRNREAVRRLFEGHRPDYVFIAAAKVGGIAANIASPAEFLLENLAIQNNLLEACANFGVTKTMFLGSSCVYPRNSAQPMREDDLMQGPLEPTNESYAVAKIAGVRLAQALRVQYGVSIICPMPCNVYGPNDHFDFERAHVVSALVRRFVEAKRDGAPAVVLWGTGTARREFLHVDDLADCCLFLMEHYDSPHIINVGTGTDYSIRELAERIAAKAGYAGRIDWDTSKPDGMPRKLLDVSRLHALGWRHRIDIEDGLSTVLSDFRRRAERIEPPVRPLRSQ